MGKIINILHALIYWEYSLAFAIIIWILMFMILVIVHELWHFIAAKKSWVKVLEFGIWIPPKMFTYYKDKSWTEYTINWLPLWWFVRLKWENPGEPDVFFAKDSFITATFWKKMIILFWWVTMNLIFAWILFTFSFWRGIEPLQVLPVNLLGIESQSYIMPSYEFLKAKGFLSGELTWIPVKIDMIMPWSIWDKAWLLTGDIILKVDNKEVNTLTLSQTLKDYIGKKFSLEYQRNNQTATTNIECPDDNCLLGIVMWQWGRAEIKPIKFWFIDAMGAWAHEIKAQTQITTLALGNLLKNLLSFNKQKIQQSVEKMSGPVWAVKVWEVILKEFWIWQYIAFWWMISLALAIFNILPIPALDGWRALWVLIQRLFRLPAERYFNIENYLNILFFVILMWLGIYIILLDLYRFWWVKIPGMG